MKNTQLKFDTITHLWSFKEQVKANHVKVFTDELLLICELSVQQIEMAINHFHAQVYSGSRTNSLNYNTP